MIPPRFFLLLMSAASLLVGCSTAPLAMDANHPASATAPEAFVSSRGSLRADSATLRTRKLLAQRERQAKAAESEMPVDEVKAGPNAPPTSPSPMKDMDGMEGMKHENH